MCGRMYQRKEGLVVRESDSGPTCPACLNIRAAKTKDRFNPLGGTKSYKKPPTTGRKLPAQELSREELDERIKAWQAQGGVIKKITDEEAKDATIKQTRRLVKGALADVKD